jgi:hypothetical protein
MRVSRIAIITSLLLALLALPAWAQDEDGSDEEADEAEGAVIGDEEADEAEPPAEPAPPPPPPPVTKSPPASSGDVLDEVDDVQDELARARDGAYVAKARILLLEEKIIDGGGSGAKVSLLHVNKLGSSYRIESISYFFDGTPVFEKVDESSEFHKKKEMKIFEGNVPPGNHTISASIVVKGAGGGAFSYLEDYTFKGQESYAFAAEKGKTSVIRMVLQKKEVLAGPDEGPEIKFEIETIDEASK